MFHQSTQRTHDYVLTIRKSRLSKKIKHTVYANAQTVQNQRKLSSLCLSIMVFILIIAFDVGAAFAFIYAIIDGRGWIIIMLLCCDVCVALTLSSATKHSFKAVCKSYYQFKQIKKSKDNFYTYQWVTYMDIDDRFDYILSNWINKYIPNGYSNINDDGICYDIENEIYRFYA